MSISRLQYAFVSGEISPQLFGRTDLEKYDLGLAELYNYFVDFRGGVSTRPGMEFVDFTNYNDEVTKFFPFRFAPNLANTYVIMFHDHKISFFQDGSPVLEDELPGIAGISRSGSGVVLFPGHPFVTGDRIIIDDVQGMDEINGRLLTVGQTQAGGFGLRLPGPDNRQFDTTSFDEYTGGGTVQRIYTIESPYGEEELAQLRAYQIRDTIRLTHPNYRIRNLVRNDHTDWTIEVEGFGSEVPIPENLAATASDVGDASVGVVVTAVDADGNESLSSDMLITDGIVNYSATAGSITWTWDAVEGAKYYNVYRTMIMPGPDTDTATDPVVTQAQQVGFIGLTYAPRFTDLNIVPDFTRSPPQHSNPFALSAIESIEVTDGGTGYPADATVAVSGGDGSGFAGFPVVDPAGTIVGVVVTNGGAGYDEPVTVTFAGTGGADATGTATLTPAEGAFPTISTVFQQRQIYAASLNDPLTIWGSQPGRFSVFDISQVVSDGDGFEFEIESQEVSPILHLLATRSGLLVLSEAGVWLLHGDSNSGAVTPTNAIADPQNYRGCSSVPPIPIDSDLLYVEGKGTTVRLLSYSEISKQYVGQNVSVLSSHLFTPARKIENWAYASNPHNLIWAVRTDGALLPFTLVKEQDVYAWAVCKTEGIVTDSCVVEEGGVDRVYLAVRRFIEGRWIKYIERLALRDAAYAEDAFCVDSGLALAHTYPAANLTIDEASGTAIAIANTEVFGGAEGKVLRVGGGKGTVTIEHTTVRATVEFEADRPIVEVMPESGRPLEAASGSWTLDTPVTTVRGLWHLEGEDVVGLADGNVVGPLTVTNGQVTLPAPATNVVLGLPFTARGRSLPPVSQQGVLENKRKRPFKVMLRVHETRGLKVGPDLAHLEVIKERTDEAWGAPTRLQSGPQFVLIDAPFDDNGQFYFVQDSPLPATVVGIVLEMDVGDDER